MVRNPQTGEIFFVDQGKKRHITSPDVLTPGAGFVNVGEDVLGSLSSGTAISTKPGFLFKGQEETEKLLKESGISL